MLTIIPFKNVSKEKEDSFLQFLETISKILLILGCSSPNELLSNVFGVEKDQIYFLIFKTNDISNFAVKSVEKNVKTLSEFFIIFANVFSQMEDLSINNKVHIELFDKLINFVCISFHSLFKNQMSEALLMYNLSNFLD